MLVNASRQGLVRSKGSTRTEGREQLFPRSLATDSKDLVPHKVDACRPGQSSQELPVQDLPGHPLPEVRHVLLCEVDWSVFGNTVSIFAGKHATVTSIHLLWNFLAFLAEELPAVGVKLFPFLVHAFLL